MAKNSFEKICEIREVLLQAITDEDYSAQMSAVNNLDNFIYKNKEVLKLTNP